MNTENALISIIVPVYNTSQYLSACVESILSQTYENLEIILIDDGSSDSSGEICDAYAEKDSRIKVIHKKNEGVSAARNDGLAAASGDFIGFVDSDDIISPCMYTELYKDALRFSSDISICKFERFYDSNINLADLSSNTDREDVLTFDSVEALSALLLGKHFGGSLCNKLFRASVVKGAEFRRDIYYSEDFLFVAEAVLKSSKISLNSSPYYFYRMRESSATHLLYNEKHLTSYDALVKTVSLMKEYGVYEKLKTEADTSTLVCHIKIMMGLCENKQLRKKHAALSVKELRKHLNKKSFSNLSASAKRHAIMIYMGSDLYFAAQKLFKRKNSAS